MSHTTAPPPQTTHPPTLRIPVLVTSATTLLVWLSQYVLPHGKILFTIPSWVTPAAAALAILGAVAMTAPHRYLRVVLALNGVALTLLVWAAGGVLFDIVMTISWLVVPDFFMPDWPSGAARGLSLVTALLSFRATVRYRRCVRGECVRCGQSPSTPPIRQRLWLGYAAFLLGLPYPILKTHWALGGTIGLDYPNPARDGFTSGWLVVPAALVGLVLSLALVHRWGRIWPRWVPGLAGKPTPRGLLLFGGWFGTGLLLTMGFPGIAEILQSLEGRPTPPVEGMHEWPSTLFYASWFLWGLVFAPATRLYQLRTQRQCLSCGLAPDPA